MEDIIIARNAEKKNIVEIAKKLNIDDEYIEQYGKYKAKIDLKFFEKIKNNNDGKLILVTSINPTPLGEGKTTAAIGIADGLNKLNRKTVLALREPSVGPVFGIKGGATGGGYSQITPMEDINLHFTGDIHAITEANNLISAIIDNHIFSGNELKIKKVTWKRAVDLNDRQLRTVQTGLSGEKRMVPREDHFDITVASEIMAVFCLSKDLSDLRNRLGKMIIGYNESDEPIYVSDLKIVGSLIALLKDAINPNLVQTLENNPCFVHGGPFANIAHGCNSVIATKMALKLGDYVVTEAGFGADLGAEKFIDIKARENSLNPAAVVIVATLKALKYHGGASVKECVLPNMDALKMGLENLLKHISNIKSFGLNPIVAINKYSNDDISEIEFLRSEVSKFADIELLNNWEKGSDGAIDFCNKLLGMVEKDNKLTFAYDVDDDLKMKVLNIVTKIYGARNVIYTEKAVEELNIINKITNNTKGFEVCVAKTQYSFSDDKNNLMCLGDFDITITGVELKNGAGFIVVKAGDIMTMPGLPKVPAAETIDVDENGNIVGIF